MQITGDACAAALKEAEATLDQAMDRWSLALEALTELEEEGSSGA